MRHRDDDPTQLAIGKLISNGGNDGKIRVSLTGPNIGSIVVLVEPADFAACITGTVVSVSVDRYRSPERKETP